MAQSDKRIETLLQRERWLEARRVILKELVRDPTNHWLLTQLGVTHYELREYRKALKPLLASLEIVPDCPLTLWNVAGTLDALGRSEEAVAIYIWLLRSKKKASDDPCWESDEWTVALMTDSVYRLGICLEHLGKKGAAEHCFRQYIDLLLAGMNGSYSMEDAARHVRHDHANGKQKRIKEVRELIDSAVKEAGLPLSQRGRPRLPKLILDELIAS